jgi:hypothetical protein
MKVTKIYQTMPQQHKIRMEAAGRFIGKMMAITWNTYMVNLLVITIVWSHQIVL